jgi:hypothetical protein
MFKCSKQVLNLVNSVFEIVSSFEIRILNFIAKQIDTRLIDSKVR